MTGRLAGRDAARRLRGRATDISGTRKRGGPLVEALQSALNYCYGAGLVVDGSFGSLTEAALKSAQKREGIAADGVYGVQTRDHLRWRAETLAGYVSCWSRY